MTIFLCYIGSGSPLKMGLDRLGTELLGSDRHKSLYQTRNVYIDRQIVPRPEIYQNVW